MKRVRRSPKKCFKCRTSVTTMWRTAHCGEEIQFYCDLCSQDASLKMTCIPAQLSLDLISSFRSPPVIPDLDAAIMKKLRRAPKEFQDSVVSGSEQMSVSSKGNKELSQFGLHTKLDSLKSKSPALDGANILRTPSSVPDLESTTCTRLRRSPKRCYICGSSVTTMWRAIELGSGSQYCCDLCSQDVSLKSECGGKSSLSCLSRLEAPPAIPNADAVISNRLRRSPKRCHKCGSSVTTLWRTQKIGKTEVNMCDRCYIPQKEHDPISYQVPKKYHAKPALDSPHTGLESSPSLKSASTENLEYHTDFSEIDCDVLHDVVNVEQTTKENRMPNNLRKEVVKNALKSKCLQTNPSNAASNTEIKQAENARKTIGEKTPRVFPLMGESSEKQARKQNVHLADIAVDHVNSNAKTKDSTNQEKTGAIVTNETSNASSSNKRQNTNKVPAFFHRDEFQEINAFFNSICSFVFQKPYYSCDTRNESQNDKDDNSILASHSPAIDAVDTDKNFQRLLENLECNVQSISIDKLEYKTNKNLKTIDESSRIGGGRMDTIANNSAEAETQASSSSLTRQDDSLSNIFRQRLLKRCQEKQRDSGKGKSAANIENKFSDIVLEENTDISSGRSLFRSKAISESKLNNVGKDSVHTSTKNLTIDKEMKIDLFDLSLLKSTKEHPSVLGVQEQRSNSKSPLEDVQLFNLPSSMDALSSREIKDLDQDVQLFDVSLLTQNRDHLEYKFTTSRKFPL